MKEGERWVRQRETESYFPPQVPVKRQSHLSSHAGSFMTGQGAVIGGRQPAGPQHCRISRRSDMWPHTSSHMFGCVCGAAERSGIMSLVFSAAS